MIRQRREQDLGRLCAVLAELEHPSSHLSEQELRAWLEEHDAEQSWVFDMAPMTVAPTKNVVGHIEMYRPGPDEASTRPWVGYAGRPAEDLMVIDKLFVRPHTHEDGIGRFLLKQAVGYVRGCGRLPVVDVRRIPFFSQAFFERHGFRAVPTEDPGVAPMVHTG